MRLSVQSETVSPAQSGCTGLDAPTPEVGHGADAARHPAGRLISGAGRLTSGYCADGRVMFSGAQGRRAPFSIQPSRPESWLLKDYREDPGSAYPRRRVQPEMSASQLPKSHSISERKTRAELNFPRRRGGQLKRVSGMIVFFGQVALDWVMERLYAAAKIKTTTKSPVKTFGIYVAPPQKGDSELMADWGPFRVHSMDNSNGFDPASLEPMLKDLSKPPGAPNV